jgi:hypothetical protein
MGPAFIANQLSRHGTAFELLKIHTGHSLGRTTARGVKIETTKEA